MIDQQKHDEQIRANRRLMRGECGLEGEEFVSDQMLQKPQPPLTKPPMRPETERIALPRQFESLIAGVDLLSTFRDRRSARVYTGQPVSLLQLSFLLWVTQGVKALRGKGYATLRTVPSGGARHAFETYLIVQHVDGLLPGAYHYLPMEHALEFLHTVSDIPATVSSVLSEQKWAGKASVVFCWSCVAYRCEWRYDVFAHGPALIDAGHVGQNLYLGCTALRLGTCGIASFDAGLANELFGLDGEEEFLVYAAPVGTVREEDRAEEQAFYHFVEEQGL